MVRKTQSTVALNAKISSVNLQAIPTDGSASFAEGAPLARDSTTYKAIAPTGGDTYQAVYVNYVDSARSDITFTQGDPSGDATAPSRSIQSLRKGNRWSRWTSAECRTARWGRSPRTRPAASAQGRAQ